MRDRESLDLRTLFRPLLILCAVLMVPIVPFVLWGDHIELWARDWFGEQVSDGWIASATIALLATDIFLPVPSSMVSTFAGARLGAVFGAGASWLGMSIGACAGFALARRWGRPFAVRFSRPNELKEMERLSERFGSIVLVLTRGVPVLAEAGVLLMGLQGLTWRQFLPAVLVTNLGIAFAYSVFGTFAAENGWLPVALGISLALPILSIAAYRIWSPAEERANK